VGERTCPMSILRKSKNKLRPFAALLAMLALMTLSLGSALAHSTAGGGAGGTVHPLSITSLTHNGEVDETEVDENEADEADDDTGVDEDVNEDNQDEDVNEDNQDE